MKVEVNRERAVEVLGVLRELWRQKYYPFDRSILPQTLSPNEIQDDKSIHASFLFYACHYMRGGIESEQVFRALFEIYAEYPWMFNPKEVAKHSERRNITVPRVVKGVETSKAVEVYGDVYDILRERIGWDAVNASTYWYENSKLLCSNWGGNVQNLIKGIDSYEEAKRRIRNKRGEKLSSNDPTELGFYGFQEKMVSMVIYFWDWAGFLKKKFLYAPPVDFHHCRLMLSLEIIKITEMNSTGLRYTEELQEPIRELLVWYCKKYRVNPKEVADVLWLYSKDLCALSPATTTWTPRGTPFEFANGSREGILKRQDKKLLETCGICALRAHCVYGIPAAPYYGRTLKEQARTERVTDGGKIVLNPRPRHLDNHISVPADYRFRRPAKKALSQDSLFEEGD